jgi:hypothetical protein
MPRILGVPDLSCDMGIWGILGTVGIRAAEPPSVKLPRGLAILERNELGDSAVQPPSSPALALGTIAFILSGSVCECTWGDNRASDFLVDE